MSSQGSRRVWLYSHPPTGARDEASVDSEEPDSVKGGEESRVETD